MCLCKHYYSCYNIRKQEGGVTWIESFYIAI